MRKINQKSVKKKPLNIEGVTGTTLQWLYSKFDDAPMFSMRRFTIEPNGFVPLHKHPWEHEIYIISGKGVLFSDREMLSAEPDDAFYILQDELHGYGNPHEEDFIFLCIIPNVGDSREQRYYTLEDLKKEGKKTCKSCKHAGEGNICFIAFEIMLQPEECYHDVNGNILGCEYGEDKI